jgi:2,3-bisphosphoglycerate-independent phosphoglycerate mutase
MNSALCQLKAHGPAVGMLSEKDMGNSEVGHNALGAGRIYDQGAKLVDRYITSGKIFETTLWKKLVSMVKKTKSTVHLLGLLSDGNVHSNISQLFGLLDGLIQSGITKVRIHILTDGRDVPSHSALTYVHQLEEKISEIEDSHPEADYKIASGGGRMKVTMDRYESDWKIVQRGWNAHVRGIVKEEELQNGYKGYYSSAEEAITHARQCFPERDDQTLPPFVIVDENDQPVGKMADNDVVINFNFRGDRAIQISRAFEEDDFNEFPPEEQPNVTYVGIMQYDGDALIPKKYLVPPPTIKNVLSQYLCANNISQFAIAETHKFGHVTYFWNGNRSGYVCKEQEKYIEIKSEPNEMIPTHPEMKAKEVCDRTIKALSSGDWKFVRVNFANGDMVGHTGKIQAAIEAMNTIDQCVKRLVDTVHKLDGITIITADHGNCEDMKFSNGESKTAHSLNPVPFFIIDKNWQKEYMIDHEITDAGLSNVAPTIINLLGLKKPKDYRKSLLLFSS